MGSLRRSSSVVAVMATCAVLAGCSGGTPKASDSGSTGHASGSDTSSTTPSTGASAGVEATGKAKASGKGNASPASSRPSHGSYDDDSGTSAQPPKSQAKVLDALPGSKSSSCTEVGSRSTVRSGSFAMGNFVTARQTFKKHKGAYDAPQSFFYVIPAARNLKHVNVTATSDAGKRVKLSTREVSEAAQWKYFPIHLKIPGAGVWTFRVSSGSKQGCFVAKFSA
jgi:hypothetical protein